MRPRNDKITFCDVWNSARSPHRAAKSLGMVPASCISRASQLRREGFILKRYRQRKLVRNPVQPPQL